MDGGISGDGGDVKRKKRYVGYVCVVEGVSVIVRFP